MRSLFFTTWSAAATLATGFLVLASARAAITWQPESLKSVTNEQGEFYNYAAAVVKDRSGIHYWFCRNAEPGKIRDHLFHFVQRGSRAEPLAYALAPAPAGWDSFHVCDPSVVKGRFYRNGERFPYALFYLGNNVDASADNQVGVAFAHSPGGPWLRVPEPVVSYPPRGHWGAGQPSAITLDRKGTVALFYTKADPKTAAWIRTVRFDPDGSISTVEEARLTVAGLQGTDGRPDHLNNFDVAYDTKRKRYVIVREVHPYPRTNPTFISTAVEVASIPAAEIRNPAAQWIREGVIGPDLTGHPRTHNAAIEKTWTGALPDPGKIRVVFTVSCAGDACAGTNSLWSYRLWEISGRMK